jgi:hypothetical protein
MIAINPNPDPPLVIKSPEEFLSRAIPLLG